MLGSGIRRIESPPACGHRSPVDGVANVASRQARPVAQTAERLHDARACGACPCRPDPTLPHRALSVEQAAPKRGAAPPYTPLHSAARRRIRLISWLAGRKTGTERGGLALASSTTERTSRPILSAGRPPTFLADSHPGSKVLYPPALEPSHEVGRHGVLGAMGRHGVLGAMVGFEPCIFVPDSPSGDIQANPPSFLPDARLTSRRNPARSLGTRQVDQGHHQRPLRRPDGAPIGA